MAKSQIDMTLQPVNDCGCGCQNDQSVTEYTEQDRILDMEIDHQLSLDN